MAVHIPFSTHPPQNLLHPPWRSSPAHLLQTPANVTAHLSLHTLAAFPSCPMSLPAPAPPGTLEGNTGEGSGPPFCLWSRRRRGREGRVPLRHIPSMLGLKVTYGMHITSGQGLILHGGLWMPRRHRLPPGRYAVRRCRNTWHKGAFSEVPQNVTVPSLRGSATYLI